jgi:hypothetical protein
LRNEKENGHGKADIHERLSELREMLREIESERVGMIKTNSQVDTNLLRGRDLLDLNMSECFLLIADILVYR